MDSTKKLKWINKAQIFLTVIASIAFIFGCVFSRQAGEERGYQKDAQSVADVMEISVTNKTNTDGSTSTFEFTFEFVIENKSSVDVNYVAGVLTIMNADGVTLLSGETYFGTVSNTTALGYYMPKKSALTFSLEWDTGITDSTQELWETGFSSLNISFELTNIRLENGEIVEVERDAYVKQNETNFEQTYQDALALFNQGKYEEASPLFEMLGIYKSSGEYYVQCQDAIENARKERKYAEALELYEQEKYAEAIEALSEIYDYKDSADKIKEIVATVAQNAEDLANVGDYEGAFVLLSKLGGDVAKSDIYKAYDYARQRYFADAVKLGLTVLVIPEGVEIVPDNYFSDPNHTNNLQKVVLPNSIKTIGTGAFSGCTKLAQINLPDGLLSINESAFSSCTALTSIAIPKSVITIGNSAFAYCSNLREISWSNTLQSIGNSAFRSCDSLTTLVLPASLLTLGTKAFTECDGLLSVTFSSGVKTIGEKAFERCTRLVSVTLAEGTEVIGSYAFSKCSTLTTIALPKSLKSISGNAFYNCSSLVEITIPEQVTSIRNYAFSECYALQRVYFENVEGWKKNNAVSVDVTDPQRNANQLRNGDAWDRK
jgi:tetratricopeptide (TPR) repeat protein